MKRMFFLITSVIVILVLSSCMGADDNGIKAGYGPSVITVDGCEYVIFRQESSIAIVHKANCRNHQEER